MTYVLPNVHVFHESASTPTGDAPPLRAHISGPHAQLTRYSEADERVQGRLGYYDALVDTPYIWPNRAAGAKVDLPYTRLWAENALLRYYNELGGSAANIRRQAGYANRIVSDTVSFTANGEYEFSDDFEDRGVKIGDIVRARFLVPGDPVELWTTVRGFAGEVVTSSVDAATADADNQETASADVVVTKIAGADNCVVVTGDASAYDGSVAGDTTETYTIIVTGSSTNGDFTTATLRIVSASGNDDVEEVIPEAAGVPTAIGARGLFATLDIDPGSLCSDDAEEDGVSAIDLIAGQRYRLAVTQAWTAPVATSGGAYAGPTDTTYVVEVTKGGAYAELPQISVTTVNGVDVSGPTDVSAAATDVAVGSQGVVVQFSGTHLRKGDRYYIVVEAEGVGPMRTLILGNSIPDTVDDDVECDLSLFIKKDVLEVSKNRVGFAPTTNWSVDAAEITVAAGIVAYDESWTSGGVQAPLELHSEESKGYGLLFVEYRAWLTTLANEVNAIADASNLADIPGALHPDNPLKWAVFKALENSNGVEVAYTAVSDPDDVDDWTSVLELLSGRDDVFNLVPLTRNSLVLELFVAHVAANSAAEVGRWRRVFLNLAGVPEIPVVSAGSDVVGHTEATTTNAEVCLATIVDDPDVSGTQYTLLRNEAGNGAFVSNGVRAGDIVRAVYSNDGFGNTSYQEFVVDAVDTEEQLRLVSGPSAAVNVAAKIEIWRTMTATAESEKLEAAAGAWSNQLVSAVWPDQIESSGQVMEGYHLCAALAGLVSGVLPQQGLTNVTINGFTAVPRTTSRFNRTQLDTMAGGGVWIVTQDTRSGEVYTRHAVTTAPTDDADRREEMFVRNLFSVSYRVRDILLPYIGRTNAVPGTLSLIRLDIVALIETLKTERATPTLGGQLIDGEIDDLRVHLVFRDRVVCRLLFSLPHATNVAEATIVA